MAFLGEYSSQELLQGQLQLWHQSFGFFKSVALAIAIDLRIADAIHRLGGAATLPQILAEARIQYDPRSNKLRDLRRVMRALTVSGIFAVERAAAAAEGPVYKLTAASCLLVVGDKKSSTATATATASQPPSQTVQLQCFVDTCQGSPFIAALRAWFQPQADADNGHGGRSLYEMAYGQTVWERADSEADAFPMDEGMAADTALLMPIVLRERGEELFGGLTSLVDVGGGLGRAAGAIAAAFPDLRCTVLDLPQVVAKAANCNVQYVGGDMFESIPPADAVFLKWILHDWGDDECVKILKNCKKAIPPRAAGGKVVIIDMVLGSADQPPSSDADARQHLETQILFDLMLMSINGVEREEHEWNKIFLEAGFQDYRIIQVLGIRSIIELYP